MKDLCWSRFEDHLLSAVGYQVQQNVPEPAEPGGARLSQAKPGQVRQQMLRCLPTGTCMKHELLEYISNQVQKVLRNFPLICVHSWAGKWTDSKLHSGPWIVKVLHITSVTNSPIQTHSCVDDTIWSPPYLQLKFDDSLCCVCTTAVQEHPTGGQCCCAYRGHKEKDMHIDGHLVPAWGALIASCFRTLQHNTHETRMFPTMMLLLPKLEVAEVRSAMDVFINAP